MLTLGSGAIAALLAIAIEGLPVVMGKVLPPAQPVQIDASSFFPTPSPRHEVEDKFDQAPDQGAPVQAPEANPSPPAPSPSPRPHSPWPTPWGSPDT